jgi:hypothetical protein
VKSAKPVKPRKRVARKSRHYVRAPVRSHVAKFASFELDTGELAKLAKRTKKQQINIQDVDVMVSAGDLIVYVTPLKLKTAA